jgi:hypothetical protein
MATRDDPVVVFSGTAWQAEQLQGLLENAGVESFLRDEVMGRIDAPALAPGAIGAVKLVVTREHASRAGQILRDFGGGGGVTVDPDGAAEPAPSASAAPPWNCPQCGQQVEGQFDACWNCGGLRPA